MRFNDLLANEGIELDTVLVLRHTPKERELRVRFKTSSRITKLSQHEANRRKFQEREGVAVEIFPVLGEAAAPVEPSDGAFDQRPYNVAKSHSRRSVMVRMGGPEAEPER
jgi:hypothetical protein